MKLLISGGGESCIRNPEGRLQVATVLYGGDQQAAEVLADAIALGCVLSQGDRAQLAVLVRERGWQPPTDEECAAFRDELIARIVLFTCRDWKREAAIAHVRDLFEPAGRPARSTVFEILRREKPKMPWLEGAIEGIRLVEEIKKVLGVKEIKDVMPRIKEELLSAESAE